MPKHDLAFYGMVFFLIGILLSSIIPNIAVLVLVTAIIAAVFLFLSKRWLAILAVFIVAGAVYNFLYDFYRPQPQLIFEKPVNLVGIIDKVEARNKSQKIIIQNIQITAPRYPLYRYGDELEIVGIINPVPEEFRGYFNKEGIFGLMSFPQIKVIAQDRGSAVKSWLFSVRYFFENSYKKVLPRGKAVFLSGLTLGSTSEFEESFEEKLRLTGTSHLVALSGYNISVLIDSLTFILAGWWFLRRWRLPLIVLFILAFVVMTGAEASVVRAAIMAGTLLLANQIGREFYFKTAFTAAAFFMVLANPKILAFDVGFQLSFAALLGIVYLQPRLKKIFRLKDEDGFLGWRKHFLNTTSAQLAVLPLLIYHFHYFSPLGILANILILELVPTVMALGFLLGFVSILSHWLALLISLPTGVFLGYQLWIINVFAKILGNG